MPNDNLTILPVWKKGASAEEFFHDMSMIARKYPGRFEKMALVYAETLSNGNTSTSYYQHGCNTTELVGLLEIGKVQVIEFTTHRD
jgi:hypothetical protein